MSEPSKGFLVRPPDLDTAEQAIDWISRHIAINPNLSTDDFTVEIMVEHTVRLITALNPDLQLKASHPTIMSALANFRENKGHLRHVIGLVEKYDAWNQGNDTSTYKILLYCITKCLLEYINSFSGSPDSATAKT